MGIIISDFDRGRTIIISTGKILIVKLRVPKGATYGWQPMRLDLGKIRHIKTIFETNDLVSDFQVFQFRTIGSGYIMLELNYIRPIKREYQPPFKYFYVTLNIR